MAPPRRTDRSRQLILDAADAAFREKAFGDVTMEEIARRAGLTRMTIYNLFASKEDIAREIVARTEVESDARYRARMNAGESALRLLEDAFLESARWCLANRAIAPLALSGPREGLSMIPPAGRPSFHGLIRDMMILGQRQGALRRDTDAHALAAVLLGAFANLMLYALTGAPFEEIWVAGQLRLIVEGIGAKSEAAPVESPRPEARKAKMRGCHERTSPAVRSARAARPKTDLPGWRLVWTMLRSSISASPEHAFDATFVRRKVFGMDGVLVNDPEGSSMYSRPMRPITGAPMP